MPGPITIGTAVYLGVAYVLLNYGYHRIRVAHVEDRPARLVYDEFILKDLPVGLLLLLVLQSVWGGAFLAGMFASRVLLMRTMNKGHSWAFLANSVVLSVVDAAALVLTLDQLVGTTKGT